MEDIRKNIARYYDVWATRTNDIDFYVSHILSDDPTVLELGCGTGRVLIPLSQHCDFVVGVDNSASMLELCAEKLDRDQASKNNAELLHGDMTYLALGKKFGLIIGPFRVFQNIDTDEQVDAFFRTVHRHLSPNGSCILNVFRPNASTKDLLETWQNRDETFAWEKPCGSGVLQHYYRRKDAKREPLVLYPELIYKYFENEELVDEVRSAVPMCVYYGDEFIKVIQDHGFSIIETWGGYCDERYGEGPELVVKFVETPSQQKVGD